jgi:2,3-bisphosphoglycerate-independent phosphoglycerate mutase
MAQEMNIDPFIHVITDGRDTPPNSGIGFVRDFEEFLKENPGTIASVIGRYYAMDRDNRWERTKAAFDAYVHRSGLSASSATEAVLQSYAEETGDEFIKPTLLNSSVPLEMNIKEEDCLVFFNFRADRMRQILKSFVNDEFDRFDRRFFTPKLDVITFTEYEKGLPVKVVFPKEIIKNPLAKVISERGLKQFHSAETEKYSHVTFFFNGGREEPFEGEDRILVPSPKVATYDLKPEMSAFALTDTVDARIGEQIDDFIIVNYANMDMVGHTGSLDAAIKAVESVDTCVGQLVDSVTRVGGISIVTSDHGNAEMMIDKINNEAHTYHTTSPVALFIIAKDYFGLRPRGILADIAPTILDLMRIPAPEEMTGRSLIKARGISD